MKQYNTENMKQHLTAMKMCPKHINIDQFQNDILTIITLSHSLYRSQSHTAEIKKKNKYNNTTRNSEWK